MEEKLKNIIDKYINISEYIDSIPYNEYKRRNKEIDKIFKILDDVFGKGNDKEIIDFISEKTKSYTANINLAGHIRFLYEDKSKEIYQKFKGEPLVNLILDSWEEDNLENNN